MKRKRFDLHIDDVKLRIAALHRDGGRPPIVLLHGFGSTKEDYADIARYPEFEGRTIIAYDAPGCGETHCSDLPALSIPFLQRTVEAVLDHFGVRRFHLVGHSMGGLTALMYAHDNPDSPLSFTNIEGNVAPEDCFLSRQVLDHPASNPSIFMEALVEHVLNSSSLSHPLYAVGLQSKVRPLAVAPIFRSMVELSDRNELFESFVQLPCSKMFVYGDENRSLSYLGALENGGVRLAEIEHSGHFPMYSNPPALWARIGEFIDRSEKENSCE